MKIALAPSHKNQLVNYTGWLEKRGLEYRILQEGETLENYSMLMLCGGPDVGTAGKRDEAERRWFKEAYGKMPVVGICRGLQLCNVELGGTLFEDLNDEKIKHTADKKEIAGEPHPVLDSSWHDVIFMDRSVMRVNSRHHQGIRSLAPGLRPIAFCKEDGLIEMAEGNNALFVQWHPERPDVWGTEAESKVYDWIKSRFEKRTVTVDPVKQIHSYFKRKGFTVVSLERIQQSINKQYTDEFLDNLIRENSQLFRKVKDKHGRAAIKLLTS